MLNEKQEIMHLVLKCNFKINQSNIFSKYQHFSMLQKTFLPDKVNSNTRRGEVVIVHYALQKTSNSDSSKKDQSPTQQ